VISKNYFIHAICTALAVLSAPVKAELDEVEQFVWERVFMDEVKARLKDPDSVKFKELNPVYKGKSRPQGFCGLLNAKNSMGGYAGFQRFYAGYDVLGNKEVLIGKTYSDFIEKECHK